MAPRKKAVAMAKPSKTAKPRPSNNKASIPAPLSLLPAAVPPARAHHASYHHPLLLDNKPQCDALLGWFQGEEETRSMPWRKAWIDPREYNGRREALDTALGKRAYEVWVSECCNKLGCRR